MRGLEKQVLQGIAVVVTAPAVEFQPGIIRAVSHEEIGILSEKRPGKG
jgi:hypothetical protein